MDSRWECGYDRMIVLYDVSQVFAIIIIALAVPALESAGVEDMEKPWLIKGLAFGVASVLMAVAFLQLWACKTENIIIISVVIPSL